MKTGVLTSLLLLSLVACNESVTPAIPEAHALSATYTDTVDGLVAKEVFTYNDNGKLTSDIYTDVSGTGYSSETYYEYDGDNLVKMKGRETNNPSGPFNVTDYTYEDGLKTMESAYVEGGVARQNIQYTYKNRVLVSTYSFLIDDSNKTVAGSTAKYIYDDKGFLVSKQLFNDNDQDPAAEYRYTYQGGNLVESCESHCTFNEYNDNAQLLKSTVQFDFNIMRLIQENHYTDNKILDETWYYRYPAYDLFGASTSILKIKYEY